MGLPVIAMAVQAAVSSVLQNRLGKEAAGRVTAKLVEEIVAKVAGDPVVKNELNAEAPWQSRVAVGAAAVIAGQAMPSIEPIGQAIETLLPPFIAVINWFGADMSLPAPGSITRFLGAVMTLSGAAYVLYGRFKAGLKPLFAGKG